MELWKNILLRGSNMVLLRYQRQIKYRKTLLRQSTMVFLVSETNEIMKNIMLS